MNPRREAWVYFPHRFYKTSHRFFASQARAAAVQRVAFYEGLQGRCVQHTTKGIYIQDGRKVVKR